MNEESETYAYFWVRGFEQPSEISERLGLLPSNAWQKGEPGKYGQKMNNSGWEFRSPLPKDEVFLDAHISALINVLESKKGEIGALQRQYEVGINCVGYYKIANPGFHLDSTLIKKCADLNLSIDFDLYCLIEKE